MSVSPIPQPSVTRTARTKIVATIGPASRSPEMLKKLIDAGVDVFRLNFSHGTHAEHAEVLADIQRISHECGQYVAILQDLCGPKMRLGSIPGDIVECPLGTKFALVTESDGTNPYELTCSYTELPDDLQVGEAVLFADGTVAMEVTATSPGRAEMKVTLPGRLRSRQGLNLPGSLLKVPSLTDKDLEDLSWTAAHSQEVQFVCLSFVRTPEDVHQLRQELQKRNCQARIVVKIEKPQAVEQLEAIVTAADAVMVARGDLGVEMDVYRVPAIQKQVIALANSLHRPVITATQMLNSMEHSSRPTRAEASDVFNAVLDGTDAVMLSGESAIGDYPVETVTTMRKICETAETYMDTVQQAGQGSKSASLAGLIQPITKAMVDAACLAAEELSCPLIVALTSTGRLAMALSNRRPNATILAITPEESTARALSLCWGVTALVSNDVKIATRALNTAIEWAKEHDMVKEGQHAILVRGELPGQTVSRTVLIRQVT
ncbi:pyruvate kinase [Planctomicrobium piriforme]|uniref:Pyruvate kinase n=1 Tax=Planctomicrobium piriforme TaxID=1576369 RepID=A0A1I3C5X9_9PLAN|nr:pyruvate kinase [Planctomicrobium piriforme]SFH69900.1 pyruvate kinase [Planctomicrobium piriforme]